MMRTKAYTSDNPRVFGFKMVPAPWRGEGEMVRRVDLEDALRYQPSRLDMMNADGVVWTDNGNTYILVEGNDFYHPGLDKKVNILSINGCGETRWKIDVSYDGAISQFDREAIRVAQMFGLED